MSSARTLCRINGCGRWLPLRRKETGAQARLGLRFRHVAVLSLAPDYASGFVSRHITDSDFNVPTTIAEHEKHLYAVNAKFGAPDPDKLEYEVVRILR